MIRGETVILINKTANGKDPFGVDKFIETQIEVKNVIVGSPTFESATSDLQLYGKKLAFILGIPKGDTHDWKDTDVYIRGQKFRTYGFPLEQTNANVPGAWNKQVKVERYE